MVNRNQYQPDFVTPPGESLKEILGSLGMTQADLARRMGRPIKTINEIIKGKSGITPETALQLELVLDIPASYWNNREKLYRASLAKEEEREQLEELVSWLKNFPIVQMAKYGWIEKHTDDTDQLRELLNFFGVVSPTQWESLWTNPKAAFRKSPTFEADPYAIASWLRKGELDALNIECSQYNDSFFSQTLKDIRNFTNKNPEMFVPLVTQYCAKAGVAVVFIKELPKTRASGATRWLSPSKALIQLSLRYKTNDHLWFTFFHEAAHILLHGKKEFFIEDGKIIDRKEDEANEFASNLLIPYKDYLVFKSKTKYFSYEKVSEFANTIGIAPGIVVGRLQHDEIIPQSNLNKLKQRLDWSN